MEKIWGMSLRLSWSFLFTLDSIDKGYLAYRKFDKICVFVYIKHMSTVKISPGGQVRIPKEVMERLHISTGDYLDFEFADDNLVVKAKKLIDADQSWFWNKEWQEAEKAADDDIKKGRLSKVFSAAEEGIAHLRKRRKELTTSKKSR